MAVFPTNQRQHQRPSVRLTTFAARLQAEHNQRRAQIRARTLRSIVSFLVPYIVIIACLLFWGYLNRLIGGM